VGFNQRQRASNGNDEHRQGKVQIGQNGCRLVPFTLLFLLLMKIYTVSGRPASCELARESRKWLEESETEYKMNMFWFV
jgi:hypothetical protein